MDFSGGSADGQRMVFGAHQEDEEQAAGWLAGGGFDTLSLAVGPLSIPTVNLFCSRYLPRRNGRGAVSGSATEGKWKLE